MDRLDQVDTAWQAWLALNGSQRHEYLRRLRDWHSERLRVGKRKLPYAGLTGCAAGSLTFGYSADYTDGTTSTVETVQPCSGASVPAPAMP